MSNQDPSTEQKIKKAARELFHQKGYEGTKTRDIAEEAGINIALMNYYFRSKKKLFDLIMLETIETFFKTVIDILWEEETSLDEKIDRLINHYIDMLKSEPDIPLFLLTEIRSDSKAFVGEIFPKEKIINSPFIKQLMEIQSFPDQGKVNPMQYAINFISLVVFPFVARPIIMELNGLEEQEFLALMDERKKWIKIWAMRMAKLSNHNIQ